MKKKNAPKNKHIELAQKKIQKDVVKKERNLNAFVNEFEARGIPLRNSKYDRDNAPVLATESDEEYLSYCNENMDVEGGEGQRSAFSMMQNMILNKDVSLVYTSARAMADLDYTYLHDQLPLPPQHLQPDPFVKLWPHQEEAIKFFCSREADLEQVGGHGLLVADEMGLGKTLQALTHVLRENQRMQRITGRRFNGATLIVTPKIVIETWQREIEKSFPPGTFHCVALTGERQAPPDLVHIENCIDLVFTTYPVLAFVYKALTEAATATAVANLAIVNVAEMAQEKEGMDVIVIEDDEDERLVQLAAGEENMKEVQMVISEQLHRYQLLYQKRWLRIIMDEAHILANRAERSFQAVLALIAHSIWLLTGTPIQNSEDNIYAYLELMRVPVPNGVSGAGLGPLRALLDKVKIRRLKKDIHSVSFHIEVDDKVEYIDFESPVERMLYLFYAEYAKSIILKNKVTEETPTKKKKKKKKKKKNDIVANKAEKNYNITSLILVMRQLCMDFRIVDKLILPNGMLLLSNNGTPIKEVTFGQKLLFKDSCHYIHVPNSGNADLERKAFLLNQPTQFEYIPAVTSSNRIDDDNTVHLKWDPYKRSDGGGEEENELTQALYETIHSIMRQEEEKNQACASKNEVMWRIVNVMGYETIADAMDAIRAGDEELLSLLMQIDRIYMSLKERSLPAIATKALHVLRYINEEMPDMSDKVIVYSDSVKELRQLEKYLAHEGKRNVLVTGESPKTDHNNSLLSQFEKDPSIRIALTSLKVGNMGLNLQCANHVLFVNAWWNPHVQTQAKHRVQRPGQTKKVYIRSFVLKDTVEEYILELCRYKESLSRRLIENNDSFYVDDVVDYESSSPEENTYIDNKEIRKHLFGYTIKSAPILFM